MTPGGINVRIRSVNSFLSWLHEDGHIEHPLKVKLLLLDTGIRIDEALRIERTKIDLDQMVLTVMGKGSKERVAPFSLELRKHIFRWMNQSPYGKYLFNTRHRSRLAYRNAGSDHR